MSCAGVIDHQVPLTIYVCVVTQDALWESHGEDGVRRDADLSRIDRQGWFYMNIFTIITYTTK